MENRRATIKASEVVEFYNRDVATKGLKISLEEYTKEIEITHEIVHDLEEWSDFYNKPDNE